MAVTNFLLPLFALSVVFLGYAHYSAWIRKKGHRTGKIILLVNTVLVVSLWAWRLPF
ncbi:MAG: hypothetical protein ACE5HV_11745 [Acidobacteriota bacterium]